MAFRLKKALRKLTAIIRLCIACRGPPSRRLRSSSFDDQTVGLRNFLEDEINMAEDCSVIRLERASSSRYGNLEHDVDQRAQIFIDNFRRHLRLESQISLRLRYCRNNSSSETEDEERSPP